MKSATFDFFWKVRNTTTRMSLKFKLMYLTFEG